MFTGCGFSVVIFNAVVVCVVLAYVMILSHQSRHEPLSNALVFPFIAPDYPAPWITFSWPMLRDGYIAPNLFHFVARPLAIAIPFAIVTVALIIAVPARRIPLAIAGAAIWIAAGFAAARSHTAPSYIRALVESVHFENPAAIERTLDPRDPNAQRLAAIAQRMRQVPPDSWPF